jgi:hypothetical protein
MLSPSSEAEVTRQRSRGLEEHGLREGNQSERGNMGTGCRSIGSFQAGLGGGGAGCGCGMKNKSPFQGSP